MNIIQLTPGAGAMYCGNCFRDNALVRTLRGLGHNVVMVPLYLPLTLDEEDQSAGIPIFFSGINVYLAQKSSLFRGAPSWLRDVFASRNLLQWASGKAAKTRPQDLGEITLSMLRGETGNQARELDELVTWLKTQPRPELICLSNALLLGLARRLKSELGASLVCTLQGEDSFLDALPDSQRAACWQTLAERASDVTLFIAPSRYFGNRMRQRLGFPGELLRVVYNGINLEGYGNAARSPESEGSAEDSGAKGQKLRGGNQGQEGSHCPSRSTPPVLGFFARMCREKGLDTLVDAYILLRQRGRADNLKLRIGGSCGPADEQFVDSLRQRLRAAGLLAEVEFHANLDRAGKLAFLQSLSVFSVPALYGEAFGLYLIEALAAGVPVVQPRTAAYPELVEATGGGVLCEPGNPLALAEAIEELLSNPARARAQGEAGRRAVFQKFSAEAMALQTLNVYREAAERNANASMA